MVLGVSWDHGAKVALSVDNPRGDGGKAPQAVQKNVRSERNSAPIMAVLTQPNRSRTMTIPPGDCASLGLYQHSRVEQCACGGYIVADPADHQAVIAAVQRHQQGTRHEGWRIAGGLDPASIWWADRGLIVR